MISASSELNKNHPAKDGRISYRTDQKGCDNYLCLTIGITRGKFVMTTARRREKEQTLAATWRIFRLVGCRIQDRMQTAGSLVCFILVILTSFFALQINRRLLSFWNEVHFRLI